MLTQRGGGLDRRKDLQDHKMEAPKCEVCLGSTDLLCLHLSAGFVEGKVA